MSGFERPRYFAGKLLTADDFELEQRYQIEKRWLLNRMFHGAGVVRGLEVAADESGILTVAPGFAVDGRGREIELCEREELAVSAAADDVSICIAYAEVETDRETIRETYELTVAAVVPEGAIVLAVLKGGALETDRD